MKVKKLFIITMLVSMLCSVYGCSKANTSETNSKENNAISSETGKSDIKSSTENKTSEENNSTKNNTNDNNTSNGSKKSEQKNSSKNDTSETSKATQNTNLNYKSKLGFSITFPSNWENKYIIKDDGDCMAVYFKSTDPNTTKNLGLLFVINKNSNPSDENFYDSIEGKKNIKAGNKTYFIGGPTDIGLDPENKDFNIYKSMQKEVGKVIGTIK